MTVDFTEGSACCLSLAALITVGRVIGCHPMGAESLKPCEGGSRNSCLCAESVRWTPASCCTGKPEWPDVRLDMKLDSYARLTF